MRSIKGLRSRINSIWRGKENLVSRTKVEIFEEVIIIEDKITPIKSTEKIKISSTHHENHEFEYFHFYLK